MDNKPFPIQIRHLVFQSLANSAERKDLTFRDIKKLLNKKHDGIAELPYVKLILKKSLENGKLQINKGMFTVKEGKSGRKRRTGRRRKLKRTLRRKSRTQPEPQPRKRRRRKRATKKKKSPARRKKRRTRKRKSP